VASVGASYTTTSTFEIGDIISKPHLFLPAFFPEKGGGPGREGKQTKIYTLLMYHSKSKISVRQEAKGECAKIHKIIFPSCVFACNLVRIKILYCYINYSGTGGPAWLENLIISVTWP
jgi:hypothetical protein